MAADGFRTLFDRRISAGQSTTSCRGILPSYNSRYRQEKNIFSIRNCETNALSKRIRIANWRRFCYEFEQLRVCWPVATTFGNLTFTCESRDRNRRVKFCSDPGRPLPGRTKAFVEKKTTDGC